MVEKREWTTPMALTMFGAWQLHGYLIVAMELADQNTNDYLHACMKQGWPGVPPEKLLDPSYAEYANQKLGPFVLQNQDSKLPGCR